MNIDCFTHDVNTCSAFHVIIHGMEGKDITRIFWNNVNEVRNARGMTWEELGRECGHGSHTLMSMKAMNRTPSFEFALEIAGALGTDVESLSSEGHVHEESTGPMTDVLAGAARGLRDEDVVLLVRSAEAMKETRGVRYVMDDEGATHVEQMVADLKRRYL